MNASAITYVDITGYAASALLILSFMMKDMRVLRTINSMGCALFIVYGILLGNDVPIIVTNAFILAFNFYYLFAKR